MIVQPDDFWPVVKGHSSPSDGIVMNKSQMKQVPLVLESSGIIHFTEILHMIVCEAFIRHDIKTVRLPGRLAFSVPDRQNSADLSARICL